MDNGKLSIIPNLIIVCYTFNISSNEMVEKGKARIDRHESRSCISIRAYILGGDLFIEIRDNGVDMPKMKMDMLNDELQKENYMIGSIGLRNVNERIKLNFGTQYGLRIETEEGKLYLAIQTENLA